MSCCRRKQRGVSLLEALIAVALLSGLTLLLAPAVAGAMRASNEVLSRAAARENHRIVSEALRQILQNAVIMDSAQAGLRIEGDKKSLHVVSLAGSSQARVFTLKIEDSALIGQIAALSDRTRVLEETRILEAGAMQFSYFGRATPNAPLSWAATWKGALPPQIVRLETSNEGDKSTFHDVHVAARGPLHCAFDTVSRRCRS